MDLIVLGASHQTAPAEIRDRIQMNAGDVEAFCGRLRSERDRILELSVLSTCNRTEIYSLVSDQDAADPLIRRAVEELKGVSYLGNGKYTYFLQGRDMVRHLFRVASGVESLMVGEPQILGQVRDALKLADHSRATGAILTRLFNTALHVGKRARTETAIGQGTVSVAYAAVEMALKVFDGLDKHTVTVFGAGETGRLVATHLAEQNPAKLLVLNRTAERGQALARELGGEYRPMDALEQVLLESDVAVTATGSTEPLLWSDTVARIARARRTRPLVLLDISNPRNIDPAVGDVENVFLYDLDALEGIAEQNRGRRAREIPKVEAIVEEEVTAFFDWYDALHVVPVLRALRDRFHEVGLAEVARQKGLTDEERESLQAYTRALINKLLHEPTTRIKGIDAATAAGVRKLVAIQELFELEIDKYTD
ncbi:MAG: glutamyl-tRNA reductase [Gemmatimonadota bacterium]